MCLCGVPATCCLTTSGGCCGARVEQQTPCSPSEASLPPAGGARASVQTFLQGAGRVLCRRGLCSGQLVCGAICSPILRGGGREQRRNKGLDDAECRCHCPPCLQETRGSRRLGCRRRRVPPFGSLLKGKRLLDPCSQNSHFYYFDVQNWGLLNFVTLFTGQD